MAGAITPGGRLLGELLPAVYFDASVLIDYWVTQGMEVKGDPDLPVFAEPHQEVIRELLKADKRIAGMVGVRKALVFSPLKSHAVTSALALLELIEWHAESAMRNVAAEAVGAKAVQRMGKKSVGDLLNRILEDGRSELRLKGRGSRDGSSGLQILAAETFIGPGFAQAHGLSGIVVADVAGFSFTEREAWDVSQYLAYLQMGMADIVHLLAARHLGCTWIASFDSDFARCREHIKDGLGLQLLTTPEEILGVLGG